MRSHQFSTIDVPNIIPRHFQRGILSDDDAMLAGMLTTQL